MDGSQEYALTTFGGGCDVRVPIDFTGDPQDVVAYSSGLVADGSTPLAAALRRGQHLGLDKASSDDVLLVLLSDGEETCDGDPVGVARLIGSGGSCEGGGVFGYAGEGYIGECDRVWGGAGECGGSADTGDS